MMNRKGITSRASASKFPCSAAKIPLFLAEQGINRNTLIARRDHAQAPLKIGRNAHDFENVPDKIPDGREIAATVRRASLVFQCVVPAKTRAFLAP
jgi:hypothetical protein